MKRNNQRTHVTAILFATLALIGGLAGCSKNGGAGGAQAGQKPGADQAGASVPVTVASVRTGEMDRTVAVTGNLAALADVTLSAKAVGRVTMVAAREGDVVHKGELVVQQYSSDLESNVQQAQANVDSADAKLRQAYVNYKIGIVNADQGVLQAKATVAQSKENYVKFKTGSRPEEIEEAKDTVASDEATMKNAKLTLDRDKALVAEGAIAQQDLDQAQTAYDTATATYNNANEALTLAVKGNRHEDIAGAADQLRQQETTLRNALINREQVALRKDDIIAAQAALEQAKASLEYNVKQREFANIYSPIDGIVATRSTEPGQEATAGTALLRIINLNTVYYQPTVSETDIASIRAGQQVRVKLDAFPGKSFMGRVSAIFPAASSTDRTFSLRVTIPNPENVIRPGMFARGSIITEVHRDVPVVPVTALVADAAGQGFEPNTSSDEPLGTSGLTPAEHVVVVGPGDKAVIRHVNVGISDMEHAEIVSGLTPGDVIVTVGQTALRDGDKLSVVNAAKSAKISQAASSPRG